MNRRRILAVFAAALLAAVSSLTPAAQIPAAAPEYGPAAGTLVIVGGGATEGTGIIEKFIELAGGPDAKFVIVPTAGGNKRPDGTIQEYKRRT